MKKKLTILLIIAMVSTMLIGFESLDSDTNINDDSVTEADSESNIYVYTNDFNTETSGRLS